MSQKNKTIQEKMSDLDKLVAWFDSEDFEIEQALEKFEQAEKLANEIEQDLESFKNEIKVIKKKFSQN